METKTLSIVTPICSSPYCTSSRPVVIGFPIRFGATLSHRAFHLPPISAVKKKIKKIGSDISSLTLAESRVLVDYVHDKFRVSIQISDVESAVATVKEQTKFDVIVVHIPMDRRIALIKMVRCETSRSLRECKEFIEGLPKKFKECVTKVEAEQVKKQLQEIGLKNENCLFFQCVCALIK